MRLRARSGKSCLPLAPVKNGHLLACLYPSSQLPVLAVPSGPFVVLL